jgi:hypothetical protein
MVPKQVKASNNKALSTQTGVRKGYEGLINMLFDSRKFGLVT